MPEVVAGVTEIFRVWNLPRFIAYQGAVDREVDNMVVRKSNDGRGVSIESALWTSDEATFQRQGQERNDCMHGCVLRAESEQTIWLDQYSRSAKCDKNTVVTVDKVGKEDIASSHHPRAIKQKPPKKYV